MDGFVVVGIIIGALLLVGLVLLVVMQRRETAPAEEVDPLFITGIAISGSGAALFATIGPVGAGLLAMGVVLMAVGIARTRDGRGHQ